MSWFQVTRNLMWSRVDLRYLSADVADVEARYTMESPPSSTSCVVVPHP